MCDLERTYRVIEGPEPWIEEQETHPPRLTHPPTATRSEWEAWCIYMWPQLVERARREGFDDADAHDLAQETWISVWLSRDRLEFVDKCTFGAHYRWRKGHFIERRQRERRVGVGVGGNEREDPIIEEVEDRAVCQGVGSEFAFNDILDACRPKLTEQEKCWLKYRYVEGMSNHEIAVKEGVSDATVSRTLNDARAKLEAWLIAERRRQECEP